MKQIYFISSAAVDLADVGNLTNVYMSFVATMANICVTKIVVSSDAQRLQTYYEHKICLTIM